MAWKGLMDNGRLISILAFIMGWFCTSAFSQRTTDVPVTKSKVVFGLAFPELVHTGISFDISTFNQIGFSAGILPTIFEPVVSLNAEHRLYFGNIRDISLRRQWFFRQSFSCLSEREKGGALAFTFGKDFSKNPRNGWTADAGVQIPLPKESSDRDFYAALRIQYYFYFRKGQ